MEIPRPRFAAYLVCRSLALTSALLAAGAFAQSDYVAPYTFTTLAGMAGQPASVDGTGSAARFYHPYGAAVDEAGNVYVADTANDTIRQITPSGVVTTLAGNPGTSGSTDGTGASAQFSEPYGLGVDAAGNIYVADTGNDEIRKIETTTANGVPFWAVTTLAGSVRSLSGAHGGSADGTGAAAQFNVPSGVAIDSVGNVYVADGDNDTIREITPGGVVTTLAGKAGQSGSADGAGVSARFYGPGGVAVDGVGNVYVADTGNYTVRKITHSGIVTTVAGAPGMAGSADGTGTAARFYGPFGVAVDSADNVYVTDAFNGTIREITADGAVITLAGRPDSFGSSDGTGSAAEFGSPRGIAVDHTGVLYVSDVSNNTIREGRPPFPNAPLIAAQPQNQMASIGGTASCTVLATGYPIPTYQWQVSTVGSASWTKLMDVDGVSGSATATLTVGTTDIGPNNYQYECVISNSLGSATTSPVTLTIEAPYAFTTFAGSAGSIGSMDGLGSGARFDSPFGLAVDATGNVYVADTYNCTIRKITPAGAVTTLAGTVGTPGSTDGVGGTARFNMPNGVAVDSAGNVYVADTNNSTVRKIAPAGEVTTLAGAAGQNGSTDGSGVAARFYAPWGIAVDGTGIVYVADASNATIRTISPAGMVATFAGTAGNVGSADGLGSAAQFSFPTGMAVDRAGSVYVADTANDTIRKITPTGMVTTLAGADGIAGNADGTGAAAEFQFPFGVTVDSSGNVYVVDSENNTIREITPSGLVSTPAGTAENVGSADGTGSAAEFNFPGALALDAGGNLYVADTGNCTIRLGRPASTPEIITQPQSQIVAVGDSVTFVTVVASGTLAPVYQWQFNGVNMTDGGGISGSTGPQLIIQGATAANNGDYACIVTTAGVAAPSNTASLVVANASNPGLASSISARAFVGTGDNILIGGFYIGGSTSRTVLVQALGPALTPLGVSGALQHPTLSIHQTQNGSDVTLYSNTGWGSSQVLLNAAAAVFASPTLPANSPDSELLLTLPPGGYSAEVSGADGGSGVALCAIYELP